MSCTFGFCPDAEVPRAMAFIDRHYRAGHPLARHRDLFDWQYGNGPGEPCNMVIATDPAGRILGLLGFVDSRRYDAALAGDNCVWLALWQVDPDARIPSLGPALLQYLIAHVEHRFLAVSGIRSVLKPLYKAMRFEVRQLSHHFLLNPAVPEYHVAIVPPGSPPHPTVPSSSLRLVPLARHSFREEVPPDVDRICRTPRRSATYFYNRYLCHPGYQYVVYAVKRGTATIGLLATRIASHDGYRVLRIVDLLLDPAAVPGLGAPILEIIERDGCEYADLMQAGLDEELTRAAGFGTSRPGAIVIPNYFEPFVRQHSPITACFRGPEVDRFVVFRADGDQDRPNPH